MLTADATVCVCHSKTVKRMTKWLEEMANILVYTVGCVNVITEEWLYNNSDIGRLTTAILAYRASIWEG